MSPAPERPGGTSLPRPGDAAHPEHAVPILPTPLAPVRLDAAGPVGAGVAEVRWCRGGDDADPPPAAPSGWRPTAGAVAGLAPVDGAGRWLVGVGDGTAKDWRAAGAGAVRAVAAHRDDGAERRSGTAVLLRPDRDGDVPADAAAWAALVTGVVLGSHRFSLRAPAAPPEVALAVPAEHRGAAARAIALARATALARDLADTPSGVKAPDWFARTVADVLAGSGVDVAVRDEHWLAAEGFGGTLAVGGGSQRPPRLLELRWDPADAVGGHRVLVGKGITFDTGGLSIKPAAGMELMRTDCAGGAAVVAAMHALAALRAPVRVSALVALAENHVSGSAYRPGDVVRHRGGTTTEVGNTDAEGRMVLADALAHTVATLDPDAVVDVATLTGAMKVALGVRTGAVLSSSDALAAELVAAGARTGERWWRLPLLAAHEPDLDSRIADVAQAPGNPGAITAALFLRRFVGEVPWAHLDIAGPARCESPHEEVAAGATGFAARTLVEWATAPAPAAGG